MGNTKKIGVELRSLTNLIRRRINEAIGTRHEDPITMMHGRAIGFLQDNNDQDMFQRDIEQEFEIARPTATKILQSMEKNGLITRQAVGYDARLKKINLTEKASQMFEEMQVHMNAFEEQLTQGLTNEEIAAFLDVIGKMKINLTR